MRVLVIGGTGLISTAIVEQLIARGHDVVLLNRGKTRSRLSVTIPVITCNRQDVQAFHAAMRELTVDAVIDMAAFRAEESQAAYEAFRGRIKHFIHCSTVCVYGGPLSMLPAREDELHTPVSEYGLNKSACEACLMARYTQDGFPVTIMRPSHTYGEGGTIIHTLGGDTAYLDRLRKGLPVVVHGDGQSLWASAHISDVARAFVNVLGNDTAIGEAYQVTGDEWMTWNQYYATVAAVLGGRFVPVYIPSVDLHGMAPEETASTYEIFQWPSIFDNGKAHRDLGYAYRIRWEEGARRTIRWIENNWGIAHGEEDRLNNRLIAAWDLARTAAYSAVGVGEGEAAEVSA
ncbi:MAG TPA: NAD-dependent epimerase/dehydratase family protein [Armatimonadota bacterium]|jgi:nucleoside-diphosphate-sugar epimerase